MSRHTDGFDHQVTTCRLLMLLMTYHVQNVKSPYAHGLLYLYLHLLCCTHWPGNFFRSNFLRPLTTAYITCQLHWALSLPLTRHGTERLSAGPTDCQVLFLSPPSFSLFARTAYQPGRLGPHRSTKKPTIYFLIQATASIKARPGFSSFTCPHPYGAWRNPFLFP